MRNEGRESSSSIFVVDNVKHTVTGSISYFRGMLCLVGMLLQEIDERFGTASLANPSTDKLTTTKTQQQTAGFNSLEKTFQSKKKQGMNQTFPTDNINLKFNHEN